MNSQAILLATLDYHRLLRKSGLTLTQPMIGMLNGLTEFLCAKAEVEEPTNPLYTADMVEETR